MKTLSTLQLCLLLVAYSYSINCPAETMQHEQIVLQHIPAKDVVPLIKPFLVKNGSISAEDYTVTLRTTAENMQQLQKLIRDLDIPTEQLQITVSLDPGVILQPQLRNKSQQTSQTNNDKVEQDPIKASANPASTVIYKTKGEQLSPGVQIIKVLQNRWSMIRTGQALPVKKRIRNPDGTITESIQYQQINQGLRIKPQLSGQQVSLYVQPFYEADKPNGAGKQIYFRQEKVINATLGSWFGLEATSGVSIPVDHNWIQQNQYAANPISLIFLKVEIAP